VRVRLKHLFSELRDDNKLYGQSLSSAYRSCFVFGSSPVQISGRRQLYVTVEVNLYVFLISALAGGEWSALHPVPLDTRAGEPVACTDVAPT
jgi:hypothetical protein